MRLKAPKIHMGNTVVHGASGAVSKFARSVPKTRSPMTHYLKSQSAGRGMMHSLPALAGRSAALKFKTAQFRTMHPQYFHGKL